ncbi:hypothetical protein MTO98_01050 [Mucilaginibacter sp. SMC90]|uniref:hypothetical protein n=1 Tax=Mucilaginibacter sp. SMC90 TaxID=2929803 RepID=UPI001FB4A21B|nr:hypothetical protein [Mucilaginibacter sp. SMC90]UOE49656.1 hypothetical protein MTO98_01050 [Mucilaginibacter sp. SMC90]
MFQIDKQRRVTSSFPIISDNYKVLHFDEYPILFSGTNRYSNKLIGSFSYEDYENDYFRYIVIIVDDKQYSDFFNRTKSYLQIINEVDQIYVIDKDINDIVLETYYLPLSEIPLEYLPSADSFIPKQQLSSSLNFGFSLKGKLADLHKALVSDVSGVSQRIYSYLEESLEALGSLSLSPRIYSQPSVLGSYRLNFDIEFESDRQVSLFPIDQRKLTEFINSFLNYVAYTLPNETDEFLQLYSENSEKFQALRQSLLTVYENSNIRPSSTISDRLIENINNSANKLSEITEYLKINESFNSIEVGSYDNQNDFSSIGILTQDYKSSIQSKLLVQDELLLLGDREVVTDGQQSDYRILVYQLNRYTGKGCARLYYNGEDYSNVRLNIDRGDQELTNSIFTKSLDEDKVVDVKGIATKINGVYKKLECYL